MRYYNNTIALFIISVSVAVLGCDPLITSFEYIEEGKIFTSRQVFAGPEQVSTVTIMSWNIRFGAGRIPWFGDSNGDRVILTKDEVMASLRGIAAKIEEVQPDILLLQEVDRESKKSAYVDELKWLLNHTYFNYAAFAPTWKAQYIPSDGLGRVHEGNAILSRWEIIDSRRIQLELRGDQDALTRYFYLRPCLLDAVIAIPGVDDFHAVAAHLTASTVDDTKKKHIDRLKEELDAIAAGGGRFVAGGDFNTLPPGATKTDFCIENADTDEHFHGPDDDPFHKEGHYFTNEVTWMVDMYETYASAVPLEKYLENEEHYFTNTPLWDGFWQKKLDFLFTNYHWIAGSDSTHQDATALSDHCPVSVVWEVPQ